MTENESRPPDADTRLVRLGIDAGGSKTELAGSSRSGVVRRLAVEGINLMREGIEGAADELLSVLLQFISTWQEDAEYEAIVIGMAGAGRARDQELLTDRLRAGWHGELGGWPRRLRVVSDGLVALETAHRGEAGIVVIAGTGSFVLARTAQGRLIRAGGWGRLLGDDGSGFAVGREALRAIAAHLDGGPATSMTGLLEERHGIATLDVLIRRIYVDGWPFQFEPAAIALDAAAEGDPVAREAVERQARALAGQVSWLVLRDEGADPGGSVALFGGMMGHRYYADALTDALRSHLPRFSVRIEERRPVDGALWMAEQLAETDDD